MINETGLDLKNRKKALRAEAEAVRAQIHAPHAGGDAARLMLERVRPGGAWPDGTIVSSYQPRGSEMPVEELDAALLAAGYDLCLPVVLGRGHPLAFRRYRPGDPLQKGVLEVMEPLATAAVVTPRVLLVPLLAFDRRGNRLGYGGGYYDRTVALLRREAAVLAIGVAYADQEQADIPVGHTDAPLDWIVTERDAFACRATKG